MITAVILSGGAGTRLWPMSTSERPKQFLALAGDKTMFEATLARVDDPAMFGPPVIVANARHEALIKEQLGGRAATVLLEPAARNTAPAIALAALLDSQAILLVMPSDHIIEDARAFHAAVRAALPLVEEDWLVTFGIQADAPETGYGYIQVGEALAKGVHRVRRFIEKPDAERAEAMIAQGDHVWNGGIFLFRADAYLDALKAHAPEIHAAAQRAMAGKRQDGGNVYPDADAFSGSPAESIDYAVMEKAAKNKDGRVAVVPVSMGWSDVGSWDALAALAEEAKEAEHDLAHDSGNNLVRSDGARIALIGVSDLIVIAAGNDILICPKGRSQDVKKIVEQLKAGETK